MLKKTKNFIKFFDIFSEPITFLLYKEKRFSTVSGGFLSIAMLIMVFFFSQNELSAVLYRTKINVEASDIINTIPPKISLNNTFALFMDPPIFGSLQGKRYFDFQILLGKYYTNSTGQYAQKKTYYNLTKCNESHFPLFSKEELKNYGINNWICPDFIGSELNFDVSGTYGVTYEYIQISILECREKGGNDTCANKSEIESIKKTFGRGKIYSDLKIFNNILDYNNYEKPFVPFLDQMQHVLSYNSSFVQKEIYFTSSKLETDDTKSFNFMRNQRNPILSENYIFEQKSNEFTVNDKVYSNSQELYLSLYLRSGTISKIYKRSYECFEDYMQVLGSLNSIFYLACFIFSRFFNFEKFIMKVAKNIYQYPHHNDNINNKSRDSCESGLDEKKGLLKFRFFLFIWRFFQFFKRNKTKSNYKKTALKKAVVKDMDIVQILMKLKEMEIFKRIFLNQDQRILLNFAAKPKIEEELMLKSRNDFNFNKKIKQKKILPFNGSITLDADAQLLFSQVSKAYRNLLNSKNEIDEKIINILDNESIQKLNFDIKKTQTHMKKSFKKPHFIQEKQPIK